MLSHFLKSCSSYLVPFLLIFLLTPSGLWAQVKPTAVLFPLKFTNFKDSAQKTILRNYVSTQMGTYFELKSEQELRKAIDAVRDKISSVECTEEKCVKLIGEALDVDYSFTVEITVSERIWDVTMRRVDAQEGVQSSKNDLCDNCDLQRARQILSEMILSMRPGGKLAGSGEAILELTSTPTAKVFLNGIPAGSTPIELTVKTSLENDVLLVAEGYEDFSKGYVLKPGTRVNESIRLVQKRGAVELVTEPTGATIFVDDEAQVDQSGNPLQTPTSLRLPFGARTILLKLPSYQDYSLDLTINQRDMGKQRVTLLPLPGRLVIRVPIEHGNSEIYLNGSRVGRMDNSIVKTLEIPANITHSIRLEDGDYQSTKQTAKVPPDGYQKIEFEHFTYVRPGPGWISQNSWHLAAMSITAISILISYDAAKSYKNLASENRKLQQKAVSADSSHRIQIIQDFNHNETKMAGLNSRIRMFDLLSLAGAYWEWRLISNGYGTLWSGTESSWIPHVSVRIPKNTIALDYNINWQWRY
ncbi:MAG: PEGA domain-containing protein [SAR324 cluster bacterium]|nr:PEGA domain-containing protein [SAR324 cluster bacterium]